MRRLMNSAEDGFDKQSFSRLGFRLPCYRLSFSLVSLIWSGMVFIAFLISLYEFVGLLLNIPDQTADIRSKDPNRWGSKQPEIGSAYLLWYRHHL